MLYAVANAEWSPGRPLTADSGLDTLYRYRAEALLHAEGRPTLAVALRYDAARGVVVPQGQAARDRVGLWAAPAAERPQGGLTVQATIPGALVRAVGPAEVHAHPGVANALRRPHFLWGRSSIHR